VYFFSSHKKKCISSREKREKEISCYDTCFSARSPDIYTRSGGSSGGWWWWGGGLQPPYHPRSHGNPFKFSIEILRRRKEKEEEGERKKKRKESPPNTQSYPYDFRQQLSAPFLE
jgi:hypothetical protein